MKLEVSFGRQAGEEKVMDLKRSMKIPYFTTLHFYFSFLLGCVEVPSNSIKIPLLSYTAISYAQYLFR
jgi:hypothetical protein